MKYKNFIPNIKNTNKIKPITLSLKAIGIVTTSLLLSYPIQAAVVRHCDFDFTSEIRTLDYAKVELNKVSMNISGSSAGKHGGVQVRTARKRARDRAINCANDWVKLKNGKNSNAISECQNSKVGSSDQGFKEKTNGRSLNNEIRKKVVFMKKSAPFP